MARIIHQPFTAGDDAPRSEALPRLGVLSVLKSTPPRPTGRKPPCARRFAALVTNPGEQCGLAQSRLSVMVASIQDWGDRLPMGLRTLTRIVFSACDYDSENSHWFRSSSYNS
jgi:hypothetical protein